MVRAEWPWSRAGAVATISATGREHAGPLVEPGTEGLMAIAAVERETFRPNASTEAEKLISGAAVAVSEAALRVQQLEEISSDSLHLILIRRVLDALDDVTDSLDFMKEA